MVGQDQISIGSFPSPFLYLTSKNESFFVILLEKYWDIKALRQKKVGFSFAEISSSTVSMKFEEDIAGKLEMH